MPFFLLASCRRTFSEINLRFHNIIEWFSNVFSRRIFNIFLMQEIKNIRHKTLKNKMLYDALPIKSLHIVWIFQIDKLKKKRFFLKLYCNWFNHLNLLCQKLH